MSRNRISNLTKEYRIQVLIINGKEQDAATQNSYYVEDICKGGIRFLSDAAFELEDRVTVLLRFPDNHTQEVLGRICYSDVVDDEKNAYGFSILDGFYPLNTASSQVSASVR